MKRLLLFVAPLVLCVLLLSDALVAFCGFYVARADAKLFNRASQVVLVRDGDRTVLTMANDFRGDPKEFAVVIPVPTVIRREQIHVGDKALIDHLDAYSAPRLVEYFDENPCARIEMDRLSASRRARESLPVAALAEGRRDKALGVTVEATYVVGEYDIQVLSATQSGGLVTWLKAQGYRLPPGAADVLGSYIRQNLKFFVAKVNLTEQTRLGFTYLRPLQVAYESPKFMLPVRLGTVNADGPQDLVVYALTRQGRVETTNYQTVKLPTGMQLPAYVKQEFPAFYRAMFDQQVRAHDMRAVFLEYAWDMGWCDPCAADPLSVSQLRELGVFWLDADRDTLMRNRGGAADVFVTRLHVRYDAAHFPDDLVFQQTADRSSFQGRYVLQHHWTGTETCEAARHYRSALPARFDREAQTLASLTGWPVSEVRMKMPKVQASGPGDERAWWERLWK
jgi:hypothetical protein